MLDKDPPEFELGDRVRIRDDVDAPFSRTPAPVRGLEATVVGDRGRHPEPETASRGLSGAPLRRLYQVAIIIEQGDEVLLDVFENWLQPASTEASPVPSASAAAGPDEGEPDAHHGHEHPPFVAGRDEAPSPASPASAELVSAMLELLMDKGLLAGDEVRRKRQEIRARSLSGGARVIARAWTDEAYRQRLLQDAVAAVRELGVEPLTSGQGLLVALPNTETVHHVIVCTLCSCYPTAVLGQPPAWYKSDNYRRRVVQRPREVLAEFGLEVPDAVRVRVVDSTADCRYLVVPGRPAGTDGLNETELAALITRDCMIGTGLPLSRPE